MKLENFVRLFAEQFDDTPIESFKPETNYLNLEEWGSLTALSIISMIDDEFQKRVSGADLKKCASIEELFLLIESK